jgi:hypothetical protein
MKLSQVHWQQSTDTTKDSLLLRHAEQDKQRLLSEIRELSEVINLKEEQEQESALHRAEIQQKVQDLEQQVLECHQKMQQDGAFIDKLIAEVGKRDDEIRQLQVR